MRAKNNFFEAYFELTKIGLIKIKNTTCSGKDLMV